MSSDNKVYDNNGQYSDNSINRYERIFGRTFISTGGLETTKDIVKHLVGINSTSQVLDVGCGMGGSAFYLHDNFGATVTGIDLAEGMINRAISYLEGRKGVSFHQADIFTYDLPKGFYDYVYSRDMIMHIVDKENLFKILFDFLKPGGQIVFTTYSMRNDVENLGQEFDKFYHDTGYTIYSLEKETQALRDAGFDAKYVDVTDLFLKALKDEMAKLEGMKEEFLKEFPVSDYEYLMTRWAKKVRMVGDGDMKWGLFLGTKPL
eukprot:TRINITY_DN18923_c0_g1_i1.p1 TRINITY_DN18923_c0_g1~~TRINITY_DN18923_c0_g1_i1.p1  ORF type:complete len:262 (-),score=55.00 TRINITY_DN18923_c0_g1_i1:146-931(-)